MPPEVPAAKTGPKRTDGTKSRPARRGRPQSLQIDTLVLSPELQMREDGTDADHVADLADVLRKRRGKLPPVQVRVVDGKNYVTDGFHTVEAHRRAGRKLVQCVVRIGTWVEAVADAAGANKGLTHAAKKTTRADRRLAMVRLVEALAKVGKRWTAGKIAIHVGLSDETVRRYLKSVEEALPNLEVSESRDGRDMPVRRAASEATDPADGTPPTRDSGRSASAVESPDPRDVQPEELGAGGATDGRLHSDAIPAVTNEESELTTTSPTEPASGSGRVAPAVWRDLEPHLEAVARAPGRVAEAYPAERDSPEFHHVERLVVELAEVMAGWEAKVLARTEAESDPTPAGGASDVA